MIDPNVMYTTDDMVFFWQSPAPFGQWTAAKFVVDRITYNCAEQFMMAEKARLFGDEEMWVLIMSTQNPAEQKRLGRHVDGFDDALWKAHREDIVFRGNMAKFTQNPALLDALLDTGDRLLVEASPYDRIWGIGLHSTDERAADPAQWRGQNLLGNVLMRVRLTLRQAQRP